MKHRSVQSPGDDGLVPTLLAHFAELLITWNARINLVAERDLADIQTRHIADSLQLAPLLPPCDGPVADLGSGGGLPGIVLAIATTRPFHLVEADRRKAAFLIEACSQLRLQHVQVHPQRIEEVHLPPLAAVTARALAPLRVLLGHAARLLSPQGVALFPKGLSAEAEIADAQARWTFDVERVASRTAPAASILRVSRIAPRSGTDQPGDRAGA